MAITLKSRPMHYEKAPPLQKVAAVMGAASATAALGTKRSGESGAKEPQKDIGKSARKWHFDLEEKDNR
jgi:hypothetical protein